MDEQSLRKKLTSEVERVSWRPLLPHQERGHLWLLAEGLDLVDVGLAVALDRVQEVSEWIQTGRLRRPEPDEVKAWDLDPVAQHFEFLIVQPFVLAIERPGREGDA
jgi:hypothetical protein